MGGGYRAALTDMMEELNAHTVVNLLTPPPDPEKSTTDLVINQFAVDEQREILYKYIGAIMAFSFLTKQPFTVDFSPVIWKQLFSYKLTLEDIKKIDKTRFVELSSQFNYRGESSPAIDKEVERYFSKYKKQVQAIKIGMEAVFVGKLDSIAYLPLEFISQRIQGLQFFERADLEKITQVRAQGDFGEEGCDTNRVEKEQMKMFWEIIDDFTPEERNEFLRFVWGRCRLPKNSAGINFLYYLNPEGKVDSAQEKKMQEAMKNPDFKLKPKWQKDSIPQSHTCTFQFDTPEFSEKKIMREQILYAMASAQSGVED